MNNNKSIAIKQFDIDIEILEKEFSDFHVTEDVKLSIKQSPKRYVNCDARIRMGLFYTDEEKQRYIEQSLSKPLPHDNQGTKVKRKSSSIFYKK